ncbi:MAG: T9SS C-terminal target domain-containing protein [Bacteroidetes bacterium]|nr:MAG: T9SS C-terminal target domain-containing protein [Bacteroidota bacterium]
MLALNIGDSVTFTADVTEYNNLTELKNVANLTVVSSGNPVAVTTISTASVNTEEYEGVLVKVMNATCTNDNAGFGMFEVNDGSGAALVDDQIYQFSNPTLNNIYNVTGVVDFSFSEYKILPRSISDIEMVGSVPVNTYNISENMEMFFNNNQLIINGASQGAVNIYEVSGKLVKKYNVNNNAVINLNDLQPGIYIAKLQHQTLKLVVN